MKLRDLLTAGVKLLGAYFTVEGVYEVVVFGLRWLLAYLGQLGYTISPTRIDDFIRLELTTGVGAMVFLMAAFLLIRRTSWCVSKLLGSEIEDAVAEEGIAEVDEPPAV